MAATVVCISRTDGANGEAVGIAVASELGYRYVDQEIVVRAAEKACRQRRFRQALVFIRQALDIWSAKVEPDARLRVLQEMARCALNCRDYQIARLAWEEIIEMASDVERLVEAHRQLAELDLREGSFDEAGRHLETRRETRRKNPRRL